MRKTQNKSTGSSKNGEYHILGQNSDFRKKSGILELEMFIPACRSLPSGKYWWGVLGVAVLVLVIVKNKVNF